METNYYLEREKCPTYGRPDDRLHIGKRSIYHFLLHILPEKKIVNLESWQNLWNKPENIIVSEYGDIISPEIMTDIITNSTCNITIGDFR